MGIIEYGSKPFGLASIISKIKIFFFFFAELTCEVVALVSPAMPTLFKEVVPVLAKASN